jgi:hypothetical protein
MKLQRLLWVAAAACFCAWLQGQIAAPTVGVARYADGTVRRIFGFESNFVTGPFRFPSADAISFSDFGGLISTGGHIQLVAADSSVIGEYDSGEARPLLNVDGKLTSAIAWLPSQQALLHWDGKAFLVVQIADGSISGKVSCVRKSGTDAAKMLVTDARGDVSEMTISLENGNLISIDPLPGVRGAAFRQNSFLIFRDSEGLKIRAADGSARLISFAAEDVAIERMSSEWLHLSSDGANRDWALHLNRTTLDLSELPKK